MNRIRPWQIPSLIGMFLLGAVALATCQPAFAQAREAPLAATLDALKARDPSVRVVEYDERQTKTIIDDYHARPPVSDEAIDGVVSLLTDRHPESTMLIVAYNGCIVDYGWISRGELQRILEGTGL